MHLDDGMKYSNMTVSWHQWIANLHACSPQMRIGRTLYPNDWFDFCFIYRTNEALSCNSTLALLRRRPATILAELNR